MIHFNKFIFVIALLFFSLNGYNAISQEKPIDELGFELMEKEKLGDLKLSMPLNRVIKLLGEPEEKTEPKLWGADGMYHQDYNYKSKGIYLDIIMEEKESEKKVNMIHITQPCKYKTKKGIGIGSAYDEVDFTYEEYIDDTSSSAEQIVAGTIYGGIIFTFEDMKVISIFIGAAAD